MHVCAVSSFVFIVPCIVAYCFRIYDVMIATFLCFVTSFVNYMTLSQTTRAVDIVTVNTIAIFYVCHSIWLIAKGHYHFINVLIVAFYSILIYYLVRQNRVHDNCHVFVHLNAALGICIYLLAYHTLTNTSHP